MIWIVLLIFLFRKKYISSINHFSTNWWHSWLKYVLIEDKDLLIIHSQHHATDNLARHDPKHQQPLYYSSFPPRYSGFITRNTKHAITISCILAFLMLHLLCLILEILRYLCFLQFLHSEMAKVAETHLHWKVGPVNPAYQYLMFMTIPWEKGPWGPSGADRTQVGPMLAPWTLLSGLLSTLDQVMAWWHQRPLLLRQIKLNLYIDQ